jgi:glycosyltransferase involved in cell wall biosynthesis
MLGATGVPVRRRLRGAGAGGAAARERTRRRSTHASPAARSSRSSYAAEVLQPLVSVILPTRDRARWIGRAIESVLAQSHRKLELLVVDDGSCDTTAQVLERFAGRLTVLSQEPAGAYVARNLALSRAGGDFVAFLDSDDVWHPHRLASQLCLMRRPEVGLVFGDAAHARPGIMSSPGGPTCFGTTPPRRGRVAEHFVWGEFVPTITVLVRRSCLEEVGGFPTSHEVSADYLAWFRIALRHELDYVPGIVAEYTVHDGGISHDLGRALQARIELFEDELRRTTDPAIRSVIQRLLFILGLQLGLAAARRRAGAVASPWSTVRGCLAAASPAGKAQAGAGFVLRQTSVRARRRLSSRGPARA